MSEIADKMIQWRWDVHKFGGTSVGSADCMRKCIEIIKPLLADRRMAMVVSAMGGKPKVTDLLLDSVHAAARGDVEDSKNKLAGIKEKHRICVEDLLCNCPKEARKILDIIDKDIRDIDDLLRAVALMRTPHEQILELVSGYGEIWSATVLSAALREAGLPFVFLNARDVLVVTEESSVGTVVQWDISEQKLRDHIAKVQAEWTGPKQSSCGAPLPHFIITGYIASTTSGIATTLKRDGSDFSASIFGKMLNSIGITIWTDVSGVYSADPRRVPEAIIIPEVSYTEAIELAYFGAKVIHPKTMSPAIMAGIPIFIRNTFEPMHPGTRIYLAPTKGQVLRERCVCGFSTVDNVSLLNLEGTGMIGVPGIAHRLFGALHNANISVMFIAQASSENSICFATKDIYIDDAKKAVEEAFFYELRQNLISAIRIINDCSIIAAVGESMSHCAGVSGIFFGALGKASVNVLAISQGCDERNISAVVLKKESALALQAVHSAFWLSSCILSIGIVGASGRVGSALVQTLLDQVEILKERFDIEIKVLGVTNSSRMILSENLNSNLRTCLMSIARRVTPSPSIDCESPTTPPKSSLKSTKSFVSLEELANQSIASVNGANSTVQSVSADLDKFSKYLTCGINPNVIMIDCSNSSTIANLHPQWLKSGAHVITANKHSISDSLELYNDIFEAAKSGNRSYLSEVTIGASVPVLTTLNDILASGDAVHSIVGLMSVSAGLILTGMCDEGLTFSQALAKTHATGIFEDDAFADLEGHEAAQKLLILARAIDFPLTREDIEVQPLAVRREVRFWEDPSNDFEAEDILMSSRVQTAKAKGCTLRYVQRIECTPAAALGSNESVTMKASVRLEDVPLTSPLAQVKGAVYHFSFMTDRYSQSPLVIQGPLSDALNTASGITGDLLRIAKNLGATDQRRTLKANSVYGQPGF